MRLTHPSFAANSPPAAHPAGAPRKPVAHPPADDHLPVPEMAFARRAVRHAGAEIPCRRVLVVEAMRIAAAVPAEPTMMRPSAFVPHEPLSRLSHAARQVNEPRSRHSAAARMAALSRPLASSARPMMVRRRTTAILQCRRCDDAGGGHPERGPDIDQRADDGGAVGARRPRQALRSSMKSAVSCARRGRHREERQCRTVRFTSAASPRSMPTRASMLR